MALNAHSYFLSKPMLLKWRMDGGLSIHFTDGCFIGCSHSTIKMSPNSKSSAPTPATTNGWKQHVNTFSLLEIRSHFFLDSIANLKTLRLKLGSNVDHLTMFVLMYHRSNSFNLQQCVCCGYIQILLVFFPPAFFSEGKTFKVCSKSRLTM